MAQSVNKAKDSHITFIVGDARSKQNISRIRSHASRAPKLDPKAATAHDASNQYHSQASSSPSPPARLNQRERRLDHSNPIPSSLAAARRDWRLSRPHSAHQPLITEIRISPNGSDDHPDTDHSSFDLDHEGKRESYEVVDTDYLLPFATGGTSPDTWYTNYPATLVGAIVDGDFDAPKRARHSAHRVSSLIQSEVDSPEQSCHGLQQAAAPLRLPSVLDVVSHASERPTQRDRKARSLHPRRRLIVPPSQPLVFSSTQRNFEEVLLRTTAFYTSRFDSKWGPMISRNSRALDADGRTGPLYESFLTVATLIEAGRPRVADTIIQGNLSVMEDLFLTEHPALYNTLVVMALDTSPSVLGQIHRHFTRAIIPIARKVLGNEHPYTQLLTCKLPPEMKASLRQALQHLLHQLSLATFGDSHHQTCEPFFICGRVFAHMGLIDEAHDVLAWLKERWENQHGLNSMLAVWVLLDEASLYLGAGIADVHTEMFLSDAMRRLKILQASTSNLPNAESRRHRAGITNIEVGALRAFGKLHIIRRNYGAALESYRRAAALARDMFGVDSPATQLAQGDLDRAHQSRFDTWQIDYSPATDEEQVEVVSVILGDVARSRVPFGREPIKVPIDKVPVYGVVPYEDLKWREGM
ncbi:hypothetical protein DV736_g2467, partial [Chaetothyriales sp. CBS 134916]